MSVYVLRSSAAGRWVHCHSAPQMEAHYPEDEGPEAREGTGGHWVATEGVRTGTVAAVGTVTPNGVTVTEEMVDGAALFMAAVWQRMPAQNVHVEQTLPAPEIHPMNGGTSDVWGMGHEAYVLHVMDYKFGRRFVDAFECWQCVDYVSAIFSHLVQTGALSHTAEAHITVEITIVQPRNYHRDGQVRSWRVRLDQLRAHFNKLRGAAEAAMSAEPGFQPGPHCLDCTARVGCSALQQEGYSIAAVAGAAIPFDLTPQQTGAELKWLHEAQKLLAARVSGLEVQALAMLRDGKPVPNYTAEASYGRLTWLPGMEESAIAVASLMGKDIRKPAEAITPTQAKALGVDASVIESYSHRPRGEMKLHPVDTKQTRKIFNGG